MRLVLPKFIKDSSAFDAKSYYEQLITTSSLPALLKRENELLAGMSSLLLIQMTVNCIPVRNTAARWRAAVVSLQPSSRTHCSK